MALQADIELQRNGETRGTLHPQKRLYPTQPNPMTEAAIRSGLAGDIYVSMGEPLADGRWLLRLQSKPLVDWIWGGCLLMAIGGGLAASDRRYRRRSESSVPADGTVPVA